MVWYIPGDCARKKITRSSAFIGRVERAAANPDEGESMRSCPSSRWMYILGSSAYLVAHYTMTTNPIAPVQSNTRLAVRARCFFSNTSVWLGFSQQQFEGYCVSRGRILAEIISAKKCLLWEFFNKNVTNFWKCPKIIVPLHRELKNRRSSSQFATIAQLAEQLTCNEQVVGSIPISSSQ